MKEIDQIIAQNTPKSLFGNRKDLSLFDGASALRKQIDGLSVSVKDILEDGLQSDETKDALIDAIGNNKTFYGMRLYRALKDTNYSPTAEQAELAVEELVKSSRGLDEAAQLDETQARELLNSMIQGNFNNAKMQPRDVVDSATLKGVSQGMLKGRKLDDLPAVRDFLGESLCNF